MTSVTVGENYISLNVELVENARTTQTTNASSEQTTSLTVSVTASKRLR